MKTYKLIIKTLYFTFISIFFCNYSFADTVKLGDLEKNIFHHKFYCSMNGNILSFRTIGISNFEFYKIYNHSDNLKAEKSDNKQHTKRYISNTSLFQRNGNLLDRWSTFSSDTTIKMIIFDTKLKVAYRLPHYNHLLSTSFPKSIYLPAHTRTPLNLTIRSYGDSAVLFISGRYVGSRNQSQYDSILSGYMMYTMSVNTDKKEYSFQRHSEVDHKAIPPRSNLSPTNAEISPINEKGEFFIVTSLKIEGINYRYNLTKYKLSSNGVELQSNHEFNGDFGHVMLDFSLGWLDDNTSLIRTFNSDGINKKRDLLHVFDWHSGTLKQSINTSKVGSIQRLASIKVDGENAIFTNTSTGIVNPDGTQGTSNSIIQLKYDHITNTLTSSIKHKNARTCNFGYGDSVYLTRNGKSLYYNGNFSNSFKIDDSIYSYDNDIDSLHNTNISKCVENKYAYPEVKTIRANKFNEIVSFNRICNVEKYSLGIGRGIPLNEICDLQSRCHIEALGKFSNTSSVSGLINNKWVKLFNIP